MTKNYHKNITALPLPYHCRRCGRWVMLWEHKCVPLRLKDTVQ